MFISIFRDKPVILLDYIPGSQFKNSAYDAHWIIWTW